MAEVHQIPFGVRTPYIPSGLEIVSFPETLGTSVDVVVGDASHPAFERALELEHQTFVSLGDKTADGSDKEFAPYDQFSTFAYAFKADTPFSRLNPDNLIGMTRFIPWTIEHGNKTIVDLARIPFKTEDSETREQIFKATFGDGTVEDEKLVFNAVHDELIKRMCRENGACREDLTVDIATLAPNFEVAKNVRLATNLALLGITAMYLMRSNEQLVTTGEGFSHYTQFTDTKLHHVMSKLGYPSQPIASLHGVLYDTAGDGVAMHADPQVTPISDLRHVVMSAESGTHFGTIREVYEQQVISTL